MEKRYTSDEYAALAVQAAQEGKVVYKLQHEIEEQVKVLEWEKTSVQVPVYNLETGEVTGYEMKEVDDYSKPVMNKETFVDPKTGEEITTYTQAWHFETKNTLVEELVTADLGYYLCVSGNITDGTLNPDYQTIKRQKLNQLKLTKREVLLALYDRDGITPEQIKSHLDERGKIEFDYADEYYRGNPLIDFLGESLGYTQEQLDFLFEKGYFPAAA